MIAKINHLIVSIFTPTNLYTRSTISGLTFFALSIIDIIFPIRSRTTIDIIDYTLAVIFLLIAIYLIFKGIILNDENKSQHD